MAGKTAAGFVIFRRINNTVQYLLLQASYGDHHWTPPKGHVDPGETNEMTTALRETEEEAGLKESDLKIYEDSKKILNYLVKGRPKTVIYWLAELINPNTQVKLSDEHQDMKWLQFKEACMLVGIERCRNSESLDTCENFGSLKIPNACDYLKERNSLIGNLVYSVSPPYKCPIKKGNYVAKNGTLDANAFTLFPVDGWYWKFSSDYYNLSNNKLLWSFCFQGGVFNLH
ncbi:Diadenosine tetraphosphatase [Carabus blaptoides fortunei]